MDGWTMEHQNEWMEQIDGMDGWTAGWMNMVITIPKVVRSEHFPKCCAQHMQTCFATSINTSLFSFCMQPQTWVDLPELAPRWQITER